MCQVLSKQERLQVASEGSMKYILFGARKHHTLTETKENAKRYELFLQPGLCGDNLISNRRPQELAHQLASTDN